MLKDKIVIGFVPLHRYPFDEKWAQELKKRFIDVIESEFPQVELVYPSEGDTKLGLVTDDEDGYKAVELFRGRGVDAIFMATLTFGDELAGALIAEHFRRIPIMIVATKEPQILPGGFRRSDSFCGTLSLASALYRRKIPFVFGGIVYPEDSEFKKQFDSFVRTASIVKNFIGTRIGLIGPRPTRFETVTFNEAKMAEKFSQRVVHITLLEVIEEARKLDDNNPSVIKIVEEMKHQVDISRVSQDAVYRQAKLEAVLRDIVEREKLSGLGFRCWTEIQRYYGVSPCYVLARLTDSGIMSSCEVDIYGVLTMLIQYAASLYTVPPHFIDWTIRHPEKPNVFLAWHCGNAPPTLMQPGCTLSYHSIMYRDVGVDRSYGTIEGVVKPGIVTISRLVEYDGEFKMFITRGWAIDIEPRVRGAWTWVEVDDLEKVYRTLVEEGFIHHASMIHGDYVEAIANACRLLGIKIVIV